MTRPEFELTVPALDAGQWIFRLTPRSDRWAHELCFEQDGVRQTLLGSVEGDGDQDWPPSPPLQDVDQQVLNDERTALLAVGMAGHGHWSASITRQPDGIEFEFACLYRGTPSATDWLGTTWELKPTDPEVAPRLDQPAAQNLLRWGDRVVPLATPDDHRRARFELDGSRLKITPTVRSNEPRVATQWSWRLVLP